MARLREFVRDLLTAAIQVRAAATFGVATLVTSIVVIPLFVRAVDAREDDSGEVAADGIVLNGVAQLDGATLTGPADVSFDVDGISAVAFRMVDEAGDEVLVGEDRFGPDFDLVTDDDGAPVSWDTTALSDGTYALFVTITLDDGDVDQRQAEFSVDNSP